MAVQPTYPGVYVQEVPSGVRTITGVSTSVTVFIGRARKGPVDMPVSCTSYNEFVTKFSADYADSELAQSVKLFFLNGGSQCYVVRIANGDTSAGITLKSAAAADVLKFTAKSTGTDGNDIRMAVTYNGALPESLFNIELFRWVTNSSGQQVKAEVENFQNLSMDPKNPRYAPVFITQNSQLVDVEDLFTLPAPAPPPVLASGYSQSGRAVPDAVAGLHTALTAAFTKGKKIRIRVNGGAPTDIDLSTVDTLLGGSPSKADILNAFQGAINGQLPATTPVVVTVSEAGPTVPAATRYFRIASTTGDVLIEPSPGSGLAQALMLGTAQGGIEVSQYAVARPVPNATVFKIGDLVTFGSIANTGFNKIEIGGEGIDLVGDYKITLGAGAIYQDGVTPSTTDNLDGVREKMAIIAAAINNKRASSATFKWLAQVWGTRLAIIPVSGGDNTTAAVVTSGGGAVNIGASFENNVRYYTLGPGGTGTFQGTSALGTNGTAPLMGDYTNVFPVIQREIDIFNLLVLPGDAGHTASQRAELWGPASVFCQERRAFLLMDPPEAWKDAQGATNPSTGVNSLRIGLVKDHSAIFFPRIIIKENGLNKAMGPSGAIAGLMARIDGSRGVWKAPAGTEADLRGIVGVEYKFSDADNGQLNPKAVNTLRLFPNGIVNWGARTMDGDNDFASEYKYIPIRRTALYIEESLYRGLKWVVFEPNDEPLWAQVRLNVGAFMHNLFRQGAFQGKTKQDAYFVKCDAETTTQNDRNLGIVNIWVGFAPLKPAEFVVLYLQQIAGQIQV